MATPINPAFMRRAIELSRNGFPAPNPHVGCVLERDGQIIGEGYHHFAGGPHAEVDALKNAGGDAKGATAYVTMEPCNHHGRTGPCSEALINAGVVRVIYATPDPNPRGSGGGDRLRSAGVEVSQGLLQEEAEQADLMWLTAMRRRRPYVVAKAAVTLDGRIALPNGESKWITGEEARRQGHILRAECGSVMVGRGTVEADNPALTVRHVGVVNQPTRIVLDPHAKLGKQFQVFNSDAPTVHINEPLESAQILARLFEQGITSILIEGGPKTIQRFHEANLIDRFELFVAPMLFGEGPTWISFGAPAKVKEAPRLEITNSQTLGRDLWITAVPVPMQ